MWCPGAGCNRIAITTDMLFAGQDGCQGITAVCGGKGGCQTRFCFLCGGEPHSGPCPVIGLEEGSEEDEQPERQRLIRDAQRERRVLSSEERKWRIEFQQGVRDLRAQGLSRAEYLLRRESLFEEWRQDLEMRQQRRLERAGLPPQVQCEEGGVLQEVKRRTEQILEAVQKADDTINEKRIQRCPRCRTPVEKIGGCNHITCLCGCKFCWLCNADITEEGYRHYCGRGQKHRWQRRRQNEKDEAVSNLPRLATLDYIHDALEWIESKEKTQGKSDPMQSNATSETKTQAMIKKVVSKKEEMRNISHFYNRYMAHNQGMEFAMGETSCVSGRADEFSKFSGIKSATDSDFLAEANAILVLSRRVLKYSYCYAYQKKSKSLVTTDVSSETKLDGGDTIAGDHGDDENLRLSLFQDHQKRLERYTEELSEVSERAFSHIDRQRVIDLMEVVGRSMKTVINFEIDYQ